jgi:hypothetical protein
MTDLISFEPYKVIFMTLGKLILVNIFTAVTFVIAILVLPVVWFKPIIKYILKPLSTILEKL